MKKFGRAIVSRYNRYLLKERSKLYLNPSKKVWKSGFDRLFLPFLSNNRCVLDTIRKTI